MTERRIPPWLHDVFGEKPTAGSIAVTLIFGGLLAGAWYAAFPGMAEGVPAWRLTLALVLAFDIFCGCAANFTASTSNYYAARPTHRIVFLSIHVHIVLIALLLDADIGYTLAIWAYTIAGAFIVNALIGRASQRFVAGVLLCAGLGGMPMLPDMQPYMLVVCSLFMIKVLYSFAVDHERIAAKG